MYIYAIIYNNRLSAINTNTYTMAKQNNCMYRKSHFNTAKGGRPREEGMLGIAPGRLPFPGGNRVEGSQHMGSPCLSVLCPQPQMER